MFKDNRTNLEISNTQRVLDGDIDDFIQAYLMAAGDSGPNANTPAPISKG
jgi:peptide chain release factor 2